MSHQAIEFILARQLASYLASPILMVGVEGNLVFYNEPAEQILGTRFELTGPIAADEWTRVFPHAKTAHEAVSPDESPLLKTLRTRRPMTGAIGVKGADGVSQLMGILCCPLLGRGERLHGAVAALWPL